MLIVVCAVANHMPELVGYMKMLTQRNDHMLPANVKPLVVGSDLTASRQVDSHHLVCYLCKRKSKDKYQR